MAGYCNPHLMFIFRLLYSGVGILLGLIICVAFTVHFKNSQAAFWGLTSSFMAAVCMAQFIYLYVIKELHRKAPRVGVLAGFGLVAILGIGVGIGGCIAYLGIGIIQSLNNQVTSLVTSEYIVCVWSFGVFKWAMTTYVYSMISFKYLKKVPLAIGRVSGEEEDDEKYIQADSDDEYDKEIEA